MYRDANQYTYRWLSAFKFFFSLWTSRTDQFCRCRLFLFHFMCLCCVYVVFSPFFSSRNNNLTRMHTRYYVCQIRSHPALLPSQTTFLYPEFTACVFFCGSSGRQRRLPSISLLPGTDNISNCKNVPSSSYLRFLIQTIKSYSHNIIKSNMYWIMYMYTVM